MTIAIIALAVAIGIVATILFLFKKIVLWSFVEELERKTDIAAVLENLRTNRPFDMLPGQNKEHKRKYVRFIWGKIFSLLQSSADCVAIYKALESRSGLRTLQHFFLVWDNFSAEDFKSAKSHGELLAACRYCRPGNQALYQNIQTLIEDSSTTEECLAIVKEPIGATPNQVSGALVKAASLAVSEPDRILFFNEHIRDKAYASEEVLQAFVENETNPFRLQYLLGITGPSKPSWQVILAKLNALTLSAESVSYK